MRAQEGADDPDEHEQGVIVVPIENETASLDDLHRKWSQFDAAECDCFNRDDNNKMLEVSLFTTPWKT